MKQRKVFWSILIIVILSIFISSCGPGQLFGPTLTPTMTPTMTPTLPSYGILGSFKNYMSAMIFYCIYKYDEKVQLPVDMDKCMGTMSEIYVYDITPGKYNLAVLPMDYSTMQAGFPQFLINDQNELWIIEVEENKLTILGELTGSQFIEKPFMSHWRLYSFSG
jgi:hypothetical protein